MFIPLLSEQFFTTINENRATPHFLSCETLRQTLQRYCTFFRTTAYNYFDFLTQNSFQKIVKNSNIGVLSFFKLFPRKLFKKSNLAGLLTYSIVSRPSHPCGQWRGLETTVVELTAAGLSGICTRFPFNHPWQNCSWMNQIRTAKLRHFFHTAKYIFVCNVTPCY